MSANVNNAIRLRTLEAIFVVIETFARSAIIYKIFAVEMCTTLTLEWVDVKCKYANRQNI